jgi:hypothetical protein
VEMQPSTRADWPPTLWLDSRPGCEGWPDRRRRRTSSRPLSSATPGTGSCVCVCRVRWSVRVRVADTHGVLSPLGGRTGRSRSTLLERAGWARPRPLASSLEPCTLMMITAKTAGKPSPRRAHDNPFPAGACRCAFVQPCARVPWPRSSHHYAPLPRPPPGLLVLDGEYFDSKASDKIEEVPAADWQCVSLCSSREESWLMRLRSVCAYATPVQGAHLARDHTPTAALPALDHLV